MSMTALLRVGALSDCIDPPNDSTARIVGSPALADLKRYMFFERRLELKLGHVRKSSAAGDTLPSSPCLNDI
jgi:hypothetical protein